MARKQEKREKRKQEKKQREGREQKEKERTKSKEGIISRVIGGIMVFFLKAFVVMIGVFFVCLYLLIIIEIGRAVFSYIVSKS